MLRSGGRVARTAAAALLAALALVMAGCASGDDDIPDDHPAVTTARDWAAHLLAGRLAEADALAGESNRTDPSVVQAALAAASANPPPSTGAAAQVTDVAGEQYDRQAFVEVTWASGDTRTTETVALRLDPTSGTWHVAHGLPVIGVDGFVATEIWLDGAPGVPAGPASRPHNAVIAVPGPHALTIHSVHPALDPATEYDVVGGLTWIVGPPIVPRVGDPAAAAITALVADLSTRCALACRVTTNDAGAVELQPLSASARDPSRVSAPHGARFVSFPPLTGSSPPRIDRIDLITGSRTDVVATLTDEARGWSTTADCGGAAECDHDPRAGDGVFVVDLTFAWDGSEWRLVDL